MEEKINKIENFVFERKNEQRAAAMMADIIGVFIGVKQAAADNVKEIERSKEWNEKFLDLLVDIGIKTVAAEDAGELQLFMAKEEEKAQELKENFERMWKVNEGGEISDKKEWKVVTEKIGELLGYPQTAVEFFINETLSGADIAHDEERKKRMLRNRYFAHSAEYEDEEYWAYDRKINEALEKYCPRTTDVMKRNMEKRWL